MVITAPFRTLPVDERPQAVHLAELRQMKIGPLFPESVSGPRESRREARGGKDTKAPYTSRRRVRRAKDAVSIACRLCRWSTSARTWRPAKLRAAEHVAKKHSAKAD